MSLLLDVFPETILCKKLTLMRMSLGRLGLFGGFKLIGCRDYLFTIAFAMMFIDGVAVGVFAFLLLRLSLLLSFLLLLLLRLLLVLSLPLLVQLQFVLLLSLIGVHSYHCGYYHAHCQYCLVRHYYYADSCRHSCDCWCCHYCKYSYCLVVLAIVSIIAVVVLLLPMLSVFWLPLLPQPPLLPVLSLPFLVRASQCHFDSCCMVLTISIVIVVIFVLIVVNTNFNLKV